ncbi:beta-lactamase [Clostridium novyi A str. 4552]|uniref:Beta-lactamase n=1 Tax=Clostridium novyi A str. 4552 TaxID=1444289 RepID=A0A0A0IFV2_CLONO|nr:MBL fold metallo-hydrolase [Clostridium novyi]KGM98460.1 beta-lactamase [Clostridium novyi A str. 4552]
MELTWFGHSSFLIKDSKGIKILTDPFDKSVGYKIYTDTADIVTISHHHYDHDYTEEIQGNVDIIDSCGTFESHGISIKGIPSYHDEVKGAKRGKNTIFVMEVDDLRICHLGDLGHTLSQETLDEIGNIDVLLIPVGGIYTINGEIASLVARAINPHLIIPMHYKTTYLSFALDSVDTFADNMVNVDNSLLSIITLTAPLKDRCKVKILRPVAQ